MVFFSSSSLLLQVSPKDQLAKVEFVDRRERIAQALRVFLLVARVKHPALLPSVEARRNRLSRGDRLTCLGSRGLRAFPINFNRNMLPNRG